MTRYVGAIFSAHAVRARPQTPLGTLGGSWSEGVALNDAGEVTGWAALPGDGQATRSSWRNGNMTRPRHARRLAEPCAAIDRHGQRGRLVVARRSRRAARLRRARRRMVDLNSCWTRQRRGWLLLKANAIDEQGRIVGEGKHDGRFRAFLLTPMAQ
jgi:hypothetical protein